MKKDKKPTKTIASVTKAINVLEFIAKYKEAGVTEISKGLDYGVSATYHLLNTLKEANIIIQDNNTKKFKLSLKLWQLGILAYEENHISDVITPFLRKLRDITGETANLTILENDKIVYVAQEESDRLVRMFTKTGATAPIHCTGGGKTILAFKAEESRNNIIGKIELDKFTSTTITDKEAFKKELDKIKKNGYGYDNEERELGVSCIAAPIFDIANNVVASISISGPSSRFTKESKEKWIKDTINIAKEVSEHLSIIK